jgi:hypothetical protein
MWLYHPSGGFVRIIDVTHGRRVILSTALDTTIVEPDEHVGLADFRRLGGRVHPDMAPVQTGSDVWCPCVPQELDHNEFAKPR